MLVQHFLENTADRFPEKVALVFGDERFSYADVESKANRLAHFLVRCGMRRGDRIAVNTLNSPESAIAIFAILKASATFVVINPGTKKDKLVFILNDCGARALITSADNRPLAREIKSAVPSLRLAVLCDRSGIAQDDDGFFFSYQHIMELSPASRPVSSSIDQDIACLIYTSGSTGEPKGVISGHNNVVFASGSIISYLQNTPDDIIISFLPFSFDYGLYQLLMVFRFGGTLVVESTFAFPARILALVDRLHVTGFPGVPTVYAMMLQMDLSRYDLRSIRYMTNTAASFPTKHILTLRKLFPRVRIFSMYGLTECKRTLYLPPEELDNRPGSVGMPIPGTETWIEDEHGNRLGPDEVGELVIRGSHVMRGYWGDEELTARTFRPGPTPGERVLYSGDLFRTDHDGYYYFIARKDEIIKSRGEKVAPKEVENVICSMEGIVEAAVVGVDDPVLGSAIKAFVVVKDKTITEKEILRYSASRLESSMVPKYVIILDALPKSPSGKVRKEELKML